MTAPSKLEPNAIREKYKDDPNWPIQSFDAVDWAKAFIKAANARPDVPFDEGVMISWFANALMRGYDEGRPGDLCQSGDA